MRKLIYLSTLLLLFVLPLSLIHISYPVLQELAGVETPAVLLSGTWQFQYSPDSKWDKIQAVSYTHLDVYKRQGEYCHLNVYNRSELVTDPGIRSDWALALAPTWDNMYKTCLLYTSL